MELASLVEQIAREVLAGTAPDPRAATLQVRTCLVPYSEGTDLVALVARLEALGFWPAIVLPRWARSVGSTLSGISGRARIIQEGDEGFCPDRLAQEAELLLLPEVSAALRRTLALREPSGLAPRLIRSVRKQGKPVWAVAEGPEATELTELGLRAVAPTDLGRMAEGSALDCHACPTVGQCAARCADRVGGVAEAGISRVAGAPGMASVGPKLARMIDHTLLKADATEAEIRQLCDEARKHKFASVCVNPTHVALAARLLAGSPVKVCTVIGFPLGATASEVKAFETQQAIADGAREVDMVVNVGALKAGDRQKVESDIRAVVQAARQAGKGVVTKVILETALLSDAEKVMACEASRAAGADFVKTSTGFSTGGATAHDVALMRRTVGSAMGVKASGGVRDFKGAMTMVRAGASRIGASASVSIVGGGASTGKGY